MLTHLYIENIAVIESTDISFGEGLNVLTGETGAGKSIVIDAINAILGQRTSRDIIRTGAKSAFVSATFEDISEKLVEKIENLGYQIEDNGVLLIQREIKTDGKGVCRVNGRPTTVSGLRELGSELINIHGQHESYELLSPETHVTYIDNMGNLEPLLQEYRVAYGELKEVKKKLDAFNIDESEKQRKIDLLKYEIEELECADLRIGEIEELNDAKNIYLNKEKISVCLNNTRLAINGDDTFIGALQALENASCELGEIVSYMPAANELYMRINDLKYELDDCATELSGLGSDDYDEVNNLDMIEERLDLIYKLGRKYGATVEEMLEYLQKSRNELEKIELSDENIEKLNRQYKNSLEKAVCLAELLSKKRQETSKKFISEVKKELVFLDMPGVNIVVSQEKRDLNRFGCDEIQLLISTNPGEPPKPISKIASGGELSRIMLAIKNVISGKDDVQTLIFDEVDTGISGSAAQKVGLKLREASNNRQVICVTHLAQIASLAGRHFLIRKNVSDSRTFTQVTQLDFEGRKREIARIIGGVEVTETTLINAEEMLKMAQKI